MVDFIKLTLYTQDKNPIQKSLVLLERVGGVKQDQKIVFYIIPNLFCFLFFRKRKDHLVFYL